MKKSGKAETQSDRHLRAYRGVGALRPYRSTENWAPTEFMFYYDDQDKMRAVAHIRRQDGIETPDGEYEMVDELGEYCRRWTKYNGKWQVKWRHRWGKKS